MINRLTEKDDKLRVAVVTMAFPSRNETFAVSELKKISQRCDQLTVYNIRTQVSVRRKRYRPQIDDIQVWWTSTQTWLSGLTRIASDRNLSSASLEVLWASRRDWKYLLQLVVLLPAACAIALDIRRNRYDVCHVFWGHYPSSVIPFLNSIGWSGVTTMFLGAYDLLRRMSLSVRASKYCDAVFTHAYVNRESIIRLGIDRDKITVVHRGVTDRVLARSTKQVTEKRPASICVVASLIPSKRVDLCIDVLAGLRSSNKRFFMEIFGGGPEESNLKRKVSLYGLEDAVFLHGHQSQDIVFDCMRRSKFFLTMTEHPSERLPNAAKEAMLARCIVVVTDTPGISELVTSGVNGIVVTRGAVRNVVGHISRLNESPSERELMASTAYQTIVKDFSPEISANRYLEVWNRAKSRRQNV